MRYTGKAPHCARESGFDAVEVHAGHAGPNSLFTGRAECIPGTMNKLIVLLLPLIPNFVIAVIYRMRNSGNNKLKTVF